MPGLMAKVYECRVQSVQAGARTLDCISRAGRKFVKISYLLPYMNKLGSGYDFLPSVGDQCLVIGGGDPGGLEVVVGFSQPFVAGAGESSARLTGQEFGPGSQMMRAMAEDGAEARIICYRGGTVLVGSGHLAVTLYTALGVIKNLFDNWILEGPGGKVSWTRESGAEVVEYNAEYRVPVNGDADGFRVKVHIGTGDVPVSVEVSRRVDDAIPAFTIAIAADGSAKIHGNVLTIEALATLRLKAANILINDRIVLPQTDPI